MSDTILNSSETYNKNVFRIFYLDKSLYKVLIYSKINKHIALYFVNPSANPAQCM